MQLHLNPIEPVLLQSANNDYYEVKSVKSNVVTPIRKHLIPHEPGEFGAKVSENGRVRNMSIISLKSIENDVEILQESSYNT